MLGGGIFNDTKRDKVRFQVRSLKDSLKIKNHFDNFPLITQKLADYHLWKQALELIQRKEHLTIEGIHKIASIKASMNRGTSSALEKAFKVSLVQRPNVNTPEQINPNWLAGFTAGEGSYMIKILQSSTHSIGFQVKLVFRLVQHQRDQ